LGQDEGLLEVVTVRRWPAARRDVHVDDTESIRGIFAGNGNGIGISYQTDMWDAVVFAWLSKCELTIEIVCRNGG
jgi:hypothetical protein